MPVGERRNTPTPTTPTTPTKPTSLTKGPERPSKAHHPSPSPCKAHHTHSISRCTASISATLAFSMLFFKFPFSSSTTNRPVRLSASHHQPFSNTSSSRRLRHAPPRSRSRHQLKTATLNGKAAYLLCQVALTLHRVKVQCVAHHLLRHTEGLCQKLPLGAGYCYHSFHCPLFLIRYYFCSWSVGE